MKRGFFHLKMYRRRNKAGGVTLLLALILGGVTGSNAQPSPWKMEIAYGSTVGIASSDHRFSRQVSEVAYLRVTPSVSQSWYSYDNSGLSPFEKVLYGSFFSIGLNRPLTPDWTFHSGIETGGRAFTITEYPTQNARNPDDIHTLTYANRARQSLLVTSLPFRFEYRREGSRKLMPGLLLGVSVNYAYAPQFRNLFYTGEKVSALFPTADLGLRWEMGKRFSLSLVYQQGFYPVVKDEVNLLSSQYLNRGVEHFPIQSLGSSLRLSLAFRLPAIRKPEGVLAFQDRKKSHHLEWTCRSGMRLCLLDDGLEDGDSVAIYVDDRLLEEGFQLSKEGYCLPLTCTGTAQVISVVPLNEGRIAPNTVRVQLVSGTEILRDEVLKSDTRHRIVIELKPESEPETP